MLQHGTWSRIVDNSGGKYGTIIKLLGYYKPKSVARVGSIVVLVIKSIKHKLKKVDVHKIYKALVIRTKKESIRTDGSNVKFETNDVILLDRSLNPIGTRILGPAPLELRSKGWAKVLSISEGVI